MKTLNLVLIPLTLFLLFSPTGNFAYALAAAPNQEVGCVVSLRTDQQLIMNDLKPAAPSGQKVRLKGQLSDYNFLVTVAENKSVLRVTVKSSQPQNLFSMTTYTPLNSNSYRPRLVLTVSQGILELRCRRWSL